MLERGEYALAISWISDYKRQAMIGLVVDSLSLNLKPTRAGAGRSLEFDRDAQLEPMQPLAEART